MGQFSVRVTVAHPTDPDRREEVSLLVDTGATLAWVPRQVVERLGIPLLGRSSFLVADGRTIERETAGARLGLDGRQAVVTVVIGESGDSGLLGVTALETLGFAVDSIHERLVPRTLLAM